MRNVFLGLACIAGLSACADGTGQVADPRYRFSGPGAYDQYRANREMALTGQAAIPHTIPKAYPFAAPTPEEIASPTAIQRARASAARAGQGSATGAGYYDPATGRNLSGAQVAAAPAAAASNPAAATDPLRRYAASQSHPVGAIIYSRPRSSTVTTAANVCATYPGAEAAQLAFLSKGGPQSDPLGMDPDGDGYVCGWDPTYYMAAR